MILFDTILCLKLLFSITILQIQIHSNSSQVRNGNPPIGENSSRNIALNDAPCVAASSFIIFGQRRNFPFPILQLGSRNSYGLYSEINNNAMEEGATTISRDTLARSSTLVGDINNDGYQDFISGFPLSSVCLVYLGNIQGFTNMRVSFAIYGVNEVDGLGWAASGLGDINNDCIDDYTIVAINSGICYLFYGSESFQIGKNIDLNTFKADDVYRIIGSIGTGIAVSSAGDFNNDGYNDILISGLYPTSSQSFIYIVFSHPHQMSDIYLESLNSSTGFMVIATSNSFAGMSLSGVGDINSDGYVDIIIGSIPLKNAQFTQQQESCVIYSRSNSSRLLLSEMTVKDGVMIIDGGLYVAATKDLNHDGINNMLIINYNGWEGQGNAYLFVYPAMKVTSSPTYQPSSMPTDRRPTASPTINSNQPTNQPSSSLLLSSMPTFVNQTIQFMSSNSHM